MVAVKGRFWMASSCKISHFGINPVRGGRPPRDSRARAAVVVMIGALGQVIASVLIFVVASSLNVRNVAEVIVMYRSRVRMVSWGLNWTIIIIQPRWAMDE